MTNDNDKYYKYKCYFKYLIGYINKYIIRITIVV